MRSDLCQIQTLARAQVCQLCAQPSTIRRSICSCEKSMPYDDLQSFLKALDAAGELRRIGMPVDPVLEVTEIADRGSKQAGGVANQALLFEKINGSDLPLSINTFGSYRRMQMALGCDNFDELAERIAEITRPEVPVGIWNKIRKGIDFLKIGSY